MENRKIFHLKYIPLVKYILFSKKINQLFLQQMASVIYGCHMSWRKKFLMVHISICESLSNRNKIDLHISDAGSDCCLKNGSLTSISNENGYGRGAVSRHKVELEKKLQTLIPGLYTQLQNSLNEANTQKGPAFANRRGTVFHLDNAILHTSKATSDKLLELGWEHK